MFHSSAAIDAFQEPIECSASIRQFEEEPPNLRVYRRCVQRGSNGLSPILDSPRLQ